MSTTGGPEQPEPPNPYQQPQQPQNPYYPSGQQPPYGQPQHGQAQQPYGYQQPYQQAPYGYTPPPPNHPSANTSMVLGIIGLAGIATCAGITLVLSPFAWGIGSRAVREIDANPSAYSGRGSANAGRIMGIVGTILLILGILAFAGILALAFASSDTATYSNT